MATLDPLPRSLGELLAEAPDPGSRNIWLFTVAKRARHVASPEKVKRVLRAVADQWHDRDFGPEIDRAVTRAFEVPDQSSAFCDPASTLGAKLPPWPGFNAMAWEQRKAKPAIFGTKPLNLSPEEILDRLYLPPNYDQPAPSNRPAGPLLCLSLNIKSAQTQPREKWRGVEAGMQFIVANPMTAPTGINQSGRVSSRCHDNATRCRHFQVIEFDRGTLEEQAAILSSLHSEQTPLVLVVWSGGKSLHGWYYVRGISEYWKLRFFRFAVFLGADATLWDPCKLVRMPGGRRDNGETQDVLHFNPKTISAHE